MCPFDGDGLTKTNLERKAFSAMGMNQEHDTYSL